MKLLSFLLLFFPLFSIISPISVSENGHYYEFRGKPTVLIGSTEHYGAVMNLDFNYTKYLDTVQKDGLSLVRTWAGSYRELNGSVCHVGHNTLNPPYGRFAAPWARSSEPGYIDGGNKFDLDKWDEEVYFPRLKDYVTQASKRGIVIEYGLFSCYYSPHQWSYSPLNGANNINNVGNGLEWKTVNVMGNDVNKYQFAMVTKIVTELASFDNVYFEVINEPYWGANSQKWQDAIISTIKKANSNALVAQNFANAEKNLTNPNPDLGVFNFHYAKEGAVEFNYKFNKIISDDETGFKGQGDQPYRQEAWEFILSGGAGINNLDYSFQLGYEDGTADLDSCPGGGGPSVRKQLAILYKFIMGFDLLNLKPANDIFAVQKYDHVAIGVEGKEYAIYLGSKTSSLPLDIPTSSSGYQVDMINPETGEVMRKTSTKGGNITLSLPDFSTDLAISLKPLSQ